MNTYILQQSNIKIKPFPKLPSRSEVCGINTSFQGLTVVTKEFGTIPWFDPGIVGLQYSDRLSVYQAKLIAKDTHLIFDYSSDARPVYDESGQPYQNIFRIINELTPSEFLSLVEEVIINGFIPVISYDGDNGDNSPYGYENALRQLPILDKLLKSSKHGDLNQYVLCARFYDGVFYGSSPEHILNFGQQFRKLSPNGHLAIEHQPGRIPTGAGPADYAPGGTMVDYDTICGEYNYSNYDAPSDDIWQVLGRMLGPAYVRPPDQPIDDDPNPPFYLAPGNIRGQYFYVALEWEGAYYWVRSQSTSAQEQSRRQYLRGCGCKYTG